LRNDFPGVVDAFYSITACPTVTMSWHNCQGTEPW